MNKKDMPELFRELFKIDNFDNNIVGVGRGHKFVRGHNTKEESLIVLVKKISQFRFATGHGSAKNTERYVN